MLKPSPEVFKNSVEGQEITQVDRRAKLLFFHLDSGDVFTTHLKLSGRLLYRPPGHPPDDYVHVKLIFTDGSELRFSNARKFGFMEILNVKGQGLSVKEMQDRYGPEPLDDLDVDTFYRILQGTRKMIKSLLMDQSRISGVGNIYANDALWMAQIHPKTPANKISREKSDALFKAIESVLKEALEKGGSSDNWYRQAHGEKGSYQDNFRVYQRAGEACDRCGTELEYMKVSQRGTFYCPSCQEKP